MTHRLRSSTLASAVATALVAAALLPATALAVKKGTVAKYQFKAPFACNPDRFQFFIDEGDDNLCGGGISTLSGRWNRSVRPEAYRGVHHYISQTNQTFKEWATYSPTIPYAGMYDVWVDWRASNNRATNTPYYVYSDDGTFLFEVNQKIASVSYTGMKWAKLGTFHFKIRTAAKKPLKGYVKVVNGSGHSEGIDAVAFKYVGPRLGATKRKTGGITLTWAAGPGTVNYEVYRGTSSKAAERVLIAKVKETSYVDTSADAGVDYYFWVKAINRAGKEYWSNVRLGRMAAAE